MKWTAQPCIAEPLTPTFWTSGLTNIKMHYSSTVSMQFTSHKLIKRVETLQEKQDLNTRCVFYPKAQKLAVPRIRPAGRQRPQTCGATQPGLAAGARPAGPQLRGLPRTCKSQVWKQKRPAERARASRLPEERAARRRGRDGSGAAGTVPARFWGLPAMALARSRRLGEEPPAPSQRSRTTPRGRLRPQPPQRDTCGRRELSLNWLNPASLTIRVTGDASLAPRWSRFVLLRNVPCHKAPMSLFGAACETHPSFLLPW